MPITKIAFIVSFITFMGGTHAAHLGQRHNSYRDLHKDTDYGSLFLNEGHFRVIDSRRNKDFIEIVGDGEIELPNQRGYCFVINHYVGTTTQTEEKHTYKVKIIKSRSDGSKTTETVERLYSPTPNVWSSKLPDLCVSGLRNVISVILNFSSSDGDYFTRTIFFDM